MDTLVRQRGELSKALLGGTLGFILLAGALALWHETFAAANFFAPVFAVLGLLAMGAGGVGRRGWPTAGRAMRMAGAGALALALTASLSLGSLLPPRLAEWLSPPLGRFGGALALGVLAGAACVRALIDPTRRRRALDLAVLLTVGALWLRAQTARQIDFPPAPTIAATVAGRLQLLLVLSLALGAIALALAVYRRRGAARAPVLAAWSRDWAVAAALLGLGLALGTHSALAPFFALPCVLIFGVVLLVERSAGLRSLGGAAMRRVGWLALVALTLALGYGLTAEDLEVVFLRNTVERKVLDRWPAALHLPSAPQPAGNLSGTVRDQAGRPLGGATVVVATIDGRAFSATSAPDGRYTLAAVPTGNYLRWPSRQRTSPAGGRGLPGVWRR